MSLQWLNQCKCERGNHNTVRGNCIARNIVGKICDDCAKNCGGLTPLAPDAATPPITEEALQILEQCFPYVREN